MRTLLVSLLCLLPLVAAAEDRLVRLYAPDPLTESGLMKHILPRFSLKTQVRVQLVGTPDQADMVLGVDGQPLFEGAGTVWHVSVRSSTTATEHFLGWLTSDVGRRTVFGFAPDGTALFTPPAEKETVVATVERSGDAELGFRVARTQCARCHAVDEKTRKTTIGSTPSFFVLRGFDDWEHRFSVFYVLKPHPAFTQIEDVTEPFPVNRPSPIVPIELTVDELEAVLAYVAALDAADLGAPLQHQ